MRASSIPVASDVLIVGAGLAGSTLAARLATAGANVTLLDQSRFPRDKLCGEFLSPECWDAFDRLGIHKSINASGYEPIQHIRLSTPRGRQLDVPLRDRDDRPGIGLSRALLDAELVQQATRAGAHVAEGVRVSGPLLRDGRVVGVVTRSPEGESLEFEASVVVAAAGRHSALVRRTGREVDRSRFRAPVFGMKRHLHVGAPVSEPSGTVGLHLVPGGYVGTCRIEAPWINVCALLPESVLRAHRGQLDALADQQFEQNPALRQLWQARRCDGDWKTVSGVRVSYSVATTPGIFYVGDCQGTIDPLGGQGMTMALLGSELLVPYVLSALHEGVVSGRLQAEYASAWHRRFDRRIQLCRLFHHALIHPSLIENILAFRSLAPRLLSACFDLTRDRSPLRHTTLMV